MSLMFACDKDALVAYLYNEGNAPERRKFENHLRECAACAAEVAALSGVRTELSVWAPPDAELGFTVVQKSATPKPADVLRPAQWWNTVPVWAQAAAAVLVLAVGAAIANVQIKSGPDGFVVSTGWISPNAVPAAAPPAIAAAPADDQWKTALIALEQQLREEIRATRETGTARAASRSEVDDATVRRVSELLEASETRQKRELALRVTQLTRDMDIQRRADLLRIEQGIGHTGVEIAKQRQMLNYVIRASNPPQQ